MAKTARATADTAIKAIQEAMNGAPNWIAIVTCTADDDVKSWLDVDPEKLDQSAKDVLTKITESVKGYRLGEVWGDVKQLKDDLTQHKVTSEAALQELFLPQIEAISTLVKDLAANIAAGSNDELKQKLEHQGETLYEERWVIEKSVRDQVETLEALVVYGQPETFAFNDFKDVDGYKWTFEMWPVEEDGSHVHRDDPDVRYYELAKDDPITITMPDDTQSKYKKMTEQFRVTAEVGKTPSNAEVIDKLIDKLGADVLFGDKLPDELPTDDTFYRQIEEVYGVLFKVGDENTPQQQKPVLWSFRMVAVDKDEKIYVKSDRKKEGDHWVIPREGKVVTNRDGTEPREETTDVTISFEDIAMDAPAETFIKYLLDKHGGTERWCAPDAPADSSGESTSTAEPTAGESEPQGGGEQQGGALPELTGDELSVKEQALILKDLIDAVKDDLQKLTATARGLRQKTAAGLTSLNPRPSRPEMATVDGLCRHIADGARELGPNSTPDDAKGLGESVKALTEYAGSKNWQIPEVDKLEEEYQKTLGDITNLESTYNAFVPTAKALPPNPQRPVSTQSSLLTDISITNINAAADVIGGILRALVK